MSNTPGLPPPKPIPLKEREAIVFVERAQLDVLDGAFVAVDAEGGRTHLPVGGLACIMLEPGARVSHRAVALAASAGTLLTWVGEAGVRLYSAGQPGGARADKLLWQARLALDAEARLRIVRKMYQLRFGEEAPLRRSVDQLRGIEGGRVRRMYENLAAQYGVSWSHRRYDRGDWDAADVPNRCLSAATACTACRRPPCSPPDMRPRSAFSIRASRFPSSTISRTSTSSTPSYPKHSASPGSPRRESSICRRNAPCVWPAAMPSVERNCSRALFLASRTC